MRKGLLLTALFAVAGLVSCQTELSISPSSDIFFTAGIDAAEAKVQLSDGVKTLWCAGDEISVFGASGMNYCFSTEVSGATATFRTSVDAESGLRASMPLVLYPYDGTNNLTDGILTASIVTEQNATPGDYGNQKPILVGQSDDAGKIMFQHASTVVRVNIVSDGITALYLGANGGEAIAGQVNINWNNGNPDVSAESGYSQVKLVPTDADSFSPGVYFFVISPGTFSSGITLSWEPEQKGLKNYKSTDNPITAIPGHLLDCGAVEYVKDIKTYQEPEFAQADVLANYEWYGRISPVQKAFMLPHIQTSFINSEWYAADNLIYVIAGEIVDAEDCENIGQEEDGSSHIHATVGYNHVRSIAPGATVKCSGGEWSYFEAYLKGHPDSNYCISIASDYLGGDYVDQLVRNPEYDSLNRILEKNNVIISCASTNKSFWNNIKTTKILNEDSPYESEGVYRSTSVNSSLNNKICVTGYAPDNNSYFGWNGDLDSSRPIGFGKEKHNIVIPMFNLNYDTASSFSTAMLSGTLGNYLSILMKTHPGVSLEGANTILQENYLREETFKYVDEDDGSIKDGGQWYFFDTDKFFEYEVLQKEAVDAALKGIAGLAGNDGSVVELPSGFGLCYTGPGVQFEVGGVKYDMTEDNRATFEEAWKADPSSVTWFFSPSRAAEFSAAGNAEIIVRVLDTNAKLIPDIVRSISIDL